MLFLTFCLFIAFAYCQTKPTVNSNFGSKAQVMFEVGKERRHFHGMWYNDVVGKRERFDVIENKKSVDVFRIWNNGAGGDEYNYHPEAKTCQHRTFHHGLSTLNIFGFLANAKLNGTCYADHKKITGARWTLFNGATSQVLCATTDGKTPLTLHRDHHVEKNVRIVVHFHEYAPGRPSASYFALPASCTKSEEATATQ